MSDAAEHGSSATTGISRELKEAIRKEAISQVSKWVLGILVVLFGIAVSGWWFYLQQKLNEYIAAKAGGVPPNAVVAIDDRRGCAALGNGWEDPGFGGKFIVGAQQNHKLWNYGQGGGDLTAVLTAEHMPQIYIGLDPFLFGNNTTKFAVKSIGFYKPAGQDSYVGGNANPKPIDILPPYTSLYLCRKKA